MATLLGAGSCVREGCMEVQRAIAVRSWDCTGSWEVGEGRARRLNVYPATCLDEESYDLRCMRAIEDLSCRQVVALGDDLSAWLAVDPSCGELFDLGPIGGGDVPPSGAMEVVPAETCPCPVPPGGDPVDVSFTNDRDEDVQLYEVDPADCVTAASNNGMTVLAYGAGSLPLEEGAVVYLKPRGSQDELGCFVVSPGLSVRIPAD